MQVTPLDTRRSSLADRVYDELVASVLAGRIAPGDRLIMDQLADALDVSRTPVRDALRRLEAEGLIEASGRRGYEVRAVGDREVVELYQAREAIEGHAARLFAELPDVDQRLDGVRSEIALAAASAEAKGIYTANRAVHRAFVEHCGNRPLLASFDALWGASLALFAYGQKFPAAAVGDLEADHLGLVAAIASRNPDRAQLAMVEHIRAGLGEHLS